MKNWLSNLSLLMLCFGLFVAIQNQAFAVCAMPFPPGCPPPPPPPEGECTNYTAMVPGPPWYKETTFVRDSDPTTACMCDRNMGDPGNFYPSCDFGDPVICTSVCVPIQPCPADMLPAPSGRVTINPDGSETNEMCNTQPWGDITVNVYTSTTTPPPAPPPNQCGGGSDPEPPIGGFTYEGSPIEQCSCANVPSPYPASPNNYNVKTCSPLTQCMQDILSHGRRLTALNARIAAIGALSPPGGGGGGTPPAPEILLPNATLPAQCVTPAPPGGGIPKNSSIRTVPFIASAMSAYNVPGPNEYLIAQTGGGSGNSANLQCHLSLMNSTSQEQYIRVSGSFAAQTVTQTYPRIIKQPADDCTPDQTNMWTTSYNGGAGLRDQLIAAYAQLDQITPVQQTAISTQHQMAGSILAGGATSLAATSATGTSAWLQMPAFSVINVQYQNGLPALVGSYPGERVTLNEVCSGWIQVCDNVNATTPGFLTGTMNIQWLTNPRFGQEDSPSLHSTTFKIMDGKPF